jgi:glycosyltransferase involved in cell wall biosynthesis
MKVLLLTRYGRTGVTSRIRFLQYLPYLKNHGVDIHVAPFLEDDYVASLYKWKRSARAIAAAYCRRVRQLLGAGRYDLLWIEKELIPWIPAILERLIGPYVVDYDDAVFHNYDMHASGLVRVILGDKIRTVMSQARTVVVGNDYLADYARRAGAADIQFVPTVVDLDHYPAPERVQRDTFTIGWIGTPWTARYLPAIAPALKEVCSRGNVRVLLIGSGEVNLGVPVEVRSWSEATEARDIHEIDVGIMPLPDEPFEQGKCGYKLLQYMACGLPAVASPVGANRKIIEEGTTGYLAGIQTEWILALERLRQDSALRVKMGKDARLKVERIYSVQAQAPRVLEVLEKARRASHPKSP